MVKLYLRKNGKVVRYHEAWISGDSLVEHWGLLGEQGASRTTRRNKRLSKDKNLQLVLEEPRERGFEPIDDDDHAFLIVEYSMVGNKAKAMLDKRNALGEKLNGVLGWTGLGHVDGGSIGSGTFETACMVVDFKVAKRVIAKELKATEFGDYKRIYCEGDE